MSEVRRYVVWKFPDDAVTEALVARARERAEMEVYDDFLVLPLTEQEIHEVLGDDLEKQRLPDGKVVIGDVSYTVPGALRFGLDVPLATSDYAGRRNAVPGAGVFDRGRAEALIGAGALRAWATGGAHKVNVVVVDGGMDADFVKAMGHVGEPHKLPALSTALPDPRRRTSVRHANMVARSVLRLAPQVELFDLAVLPERIDDVDRWASHVIQGLADLHARILTAKLKPVPPSWVIVCAWGLLSRKYDRDLGTYVGSSVHPLSVIFRALEQLGADIVFSAGNNGLFWPDLRSTGCDRGPLNSIMGSNGLSEVLTVGAVTPLGDWIGESSQGPEPDGLRDAAKHDGPRKPDVCAPSWFHETGDRHALSTGTSAACAMAAGVVAAVRRRVPQSALPPAALIDLIRATARREGFSGGATRATPAEWRLGSGVIDARALVNNLPLSVLPSIRFT